MSTINSSLKTLMNLAKVQAVISRRFDRLNIHGIGFSDFIILYLLQQSAEGKMRRIDLADRIGLTASGITRMLLPMEKIGLVTREANERDARVSYVVLTPAGRQLFEDAKLTAEALAMEIIPKEKEKKLNPLTDLLATLGGNIS
jgi:DNA-binding MarR family transcriptional regulator